MAEIDPFTLRRLARFVESYRKDQGQLPTLQEFERAGFPRQVIDVALKQNVLSLFYVTLTNGTIVKGYKLKD